jgi:hypothetical protein
MCAIVLDIVRPFTSLRDTKPAPTVAGTPWYLSARVHFSYAAVMDLAKNDFVCPVCGQPMRLLTVLKHAPGEQTFVVQCRPCGLSTTRTVDAPRQNDSAR